MPITIEETHLLDLLESVAKWMNDQTDFALYQTGGGSEYNYLLGEIELALAVAGRRKIWKQGDAS